MDDDERPALQLVELETFIQDLQTELRDIIELAKVAADVMEVIPHDGRDRRRKRGGTWRHKDRDEPGELASIDIAGMKYEALWLMRRLRTHADLMTEAAEQALHELTALHDLLIAAAARKTKTNSD